MAKAMSRGARVLSASNRTTTHIRAVRQAPVATIRLTLILGVLAVLTSILGIAHPGGFYSAYTNPLAGLVGQDIATLVAGVPVLVTGAWLARRGSVAGLLTWAAGLFYLAYSYFFFVVGATAVGFVLYVLIVALALHGFMSLLLDIDPDALAANSGSGMPVRPAAAFLFGTGLLFGLMWGGMSIGATLSGQALDPVVHLVVVADACVLLPALLAAGWKLWHGSAWGIALGGILLVKVALTAGTVAFGTVLNALWTGSLAASDAFLLVLFGAMALGATALAVPYLRSFQRVPADQA